MAKNHSYKKDRSPQIHHPFEEIESEHQDPEIIYHEKKHRGPILFGSILAIAIAIIFSMVSGGFSSEGKPEEVVANRISHATKAGSQVFDTEVNSGITPKDFNLTVSNNGGSARMLIWDFNKEDLDEVQIFVDGQPVKEKLILTKDAAAISIPVPSTVTIKGLTDHGGGISYAVKFPEEEITYFNVVTVGGANTYVVKPKL